MSKPLSAIHHVPMWSLVPGEDSSTGNVTGGRKLARYDLVAVVGRCGRTLGSRQLYPFNQRRVIELLTRFGTGRRSLPRLRCPAW